MFKDLLGQMKCIYSGLDPATLLADLHCNTDKLKLTMRYELHFGIAAFIHVDSYYLR